MRSSTVYVIHYKNKNVSRTEQFRTSNLDHRVLRAILYLEGLSISTERVAYIWNLRVAKNAFSPYLSFCCSVNRCHIN